jgi:uncharacterized protein YlaI
MKVICILCNQTFQPDKQTERKIIKHPHKIQLCSHCYIRIKKQSLEREKRVPQPAKRKNSRFRRSSLFKRR